MEDDGWKSTTFRADLKRAAQYEGDSRACDIQAYKLPYDVKDDCKGWGAQNSKDNEERRQMDTHRIRGPTRKMTGSARQNRQAIVERDAHRHVCDVLGG